MKNIFIFDMDGTLTPSRRKMTKDFEEFYSNWAENHTFFLVSGSNLEKIKEQVPEYILNLSEGVFTCGGNQLWLNGELSYNHEFKPEDDLLYFLKEKLHEKAHSIGVTLEHYLAPQVYYPLEDGGTYYGYKSFHPNNKRTVPLNLNGPTPTDYSQLESDFF